MFVDEIVFYFRRGEEEVKQMKKIRQLPAPDFERKITSLSR